MLPCYEKGFEAQEKDDMKENKFSGCQMNFLSLPSRQQQQGPYAKHDGNGNENVTKQKV